MDIKLRKTLIELDNTKTKVKEMLEQKEKQDIENDEWIAKVYKNMSTDGKKDFINAFTVAGPLLRRGTVSRLRKTTGLNFSKITIKTTEDEIKLKKEIMEFAEENTIDVPDKKK